MTLQCRAASLFRKKDIDTQAEMVGFPFSRTGRGEKISAKTISSRTAERENAPATKTQARGNFETVAKGKCVSFWRVNGEKESISAQGDKGRILATISSRPIWAFLRFFLLVQFHIVGRCPPFLRKTLELNDASSLKVPRRPSPPFSLAIFPPVFFLRQHSPVGGSPSRRSPDALLVGAAFIYCTPEFNRRRLFGNQRWKWEK